MKAFRPISPNVLLANLHPTEAPNIKQTIINNLR